MTSVKRQSTSVITKLLLVILAGSVVICLTTWGAAFLIIRQIINQTRIAYEPEEAAKIAQEITDYDLPPGYHETVGSSAFGMVNLMLTGQDSTSTIWIIQSPKYGTIGPDMFLRAYQTNYQINWETVDAKLVTVRGEKTSLTIFQGYSTDNQLYHAWVGSFKGRKGPAALIIFGPDETWDQAIAEDFINSMR